MAEPVMMIELYESAWKKTEYERRTKVTVENIQQLLIKINKMDIKSEYSLTKTC
jgi:hypothetical protein